MPKDFYVQEDAQDPVLDAATILALVRTHAPEARALTGVDEHGGEARTYAIDEDLILKVQRPPRLRPRTSLKKEAFFLRHLEGVEGVSVPRVLGHGATGSGTAYTLLTRMPGIAVRDADLTGEAPRQALFDLGVMLRRVHAVEQAPLFASRLFPGDHTPADVRVHFGELFRDALALVESRPDAWTVPFSAHDVARAAMRALPDVDATAPLHSNPGPEHVFVDGETGCLSGLIDFGDAYFGHPVNDLRRWPSPEDRQALLEGYASLGGVSENFRATWRVACALTDLVAVVRFPYLRNTASTELRELLAFWANGR